MAKFLSNHATSSEATAILATPSGARLISDVAPCRVVDPERLSYHVLRPQQVGPADMALMGETYRAWSDVWTETFAELGEPQRLASDNFTRQDEIGALFHEWECIGMTFFRYVDLANPIYRNDSYFAPWSPAALETATSRGTRICISSNFTISAEWRSAKGCSIKDVLGTLIVERFLRSDSAAFVGTMRNDRGMNKLTYRFGAVPVERDAIHHGVSVDLIAYYRGESVRPRMADDVESVVARVIEGWQ